MTQERHNPKRRQTLAESRLLMAYLAERYEGRQWFVHPRMGADPDMTGIDPADEGRRRFQRNFNRWADAVVVDERELIVIEARMWDPSRAVGKLLEYMLLVPATPDLQPFLPRRLVGEVLTLQHDALGQLVIERAGLRYVHFDRPWAEDYYAIYPRNRRVAPHVGLVERLAQLTDDSP